MMPAVLSCTNLAPLLADFRWFRPGVSTTAHNVDNLFFLISVICAFFFLLIVVLQAWFMWKYRARDGHREENSPHHNNALEVTWSVIPLILVIWIFYKGFTGYIDMRQPPENALAIEVTAQKWSWSFKYPNGAVSPVLHVPADQPVKLILSSKDVLHSLYIPAFRVKMDCVPGRYTEMWFEATTPSDEFSDPVFDDDPNTDNKYTDGSSIFAEAEPTRGYDLFCTEYCGTGHSSMITKCVVHTEAGFEQEMKTLADPRSQGAPAEVGEKLYRQRGCAQCHSVDGVDNPGNGGPSFKGYYGKEVEFTDGATAEMDANYIRESILNPQAKIRKGYRPIMPTFQGQLNDDEIYAIRQFIRTLNDQDAQDWQPKEGEQDDQAAQEPNPVVADQGPTDSEDPDEAAEQDGGGQPEPPADAAEDPASEDANTASAGDNADDAGNDPAEQDTPVAEQPAAQDEPAAEADPEQPSDTDQTADTDQPTDTGADPEEDS